MSYLLFFETDNKETRMRIASNLHDLLEMIIYNYELVGSFFECYTLTYTKGTIPQSKFFDIKKEKEYKKELENAQEIYFCYDYGKLIEKELELIG